MTAGVPDKLTQLQGTSRSRNPYTAHGQKARDEFMRKVEMLRLFQVSAHQQPSGKPGFDVVEACTNHHLCDLTHEGTQVGTEPTL